MTSIHDDIEWDLGRSAYVPQEYVRPWDREGWGGSDVVVTPPREGAWKPNKPGFQQGQRDYQYMATEKEQRRERARELADQARKEGIDWRERQLPREAIVNRDSAPPEKVYPDWREEVVIQPVPTSSPRGSMPYHRRQRNTRPSLRDQLIGDMRNNWR